MVDSVLPGSETAFLLSEVTRLWRQAFEKALQASAIELTASEVRTLAYVARSGGLKQRSLADLMNVDPMTVSAVIDALERAQFVERKVDPSDKRARLVYLTPASQTVLEALVPITADAYGRAMQGMDADQRDALRRTLRQVCHNLSAEGVAAAPN